MDLNSDGNLDLGSTNETSAGAAGNPYWSYFKLPGTTYFYGTGTATGAGDRTNILLGVLAIHLQHRPQLRDEPVGDHNHKSAGNIVRL